MKRLTAMMVLSVLSIAAFAFAGFAQEGQAQDKKKEPVIDSQVKEVQGEVSYIGKRSFSVVTARDDAKGEETEIRLSYDTGLIVEHKKSLDEIQPGDMVTVKYLDETTDYGDTKETKLMAKVVTFMNPASQDSPYKKAREDLQQKVTQDESLSLKGVKSDE